VPTDGRLTSSTVHIALVCPYSLSRPGGVQGQVVGLAQEFAQLGHRVTVFAPLDDPADAPNWLDVGVELVTTGRSVSLPANGSEAPVTLSVPAVARALRTLKWIAPDVVHVHEPFTPGLPYGLLVSPPRQPMVATFHRSGPSRLYTLLGPVVRRLANRFAVRAAVSDAARTTAFHALGGNYEVGFNGVDVDAYRSAEPWPTDRPAILFLGRHEERKGLSVLLDAFEELRRGPGSPVLWIAGSGPLTEMLRRRYPPSSDVEWLGVLSEVDKRRRLVAAEVLCAPSLGGESFGMVLLEAMAAKTVVVASDIDGYRQAAGGHAVLVPPADVPGLGAALWAVLQGRIADGRAGSAQGEGPGTSWLSAGSAWAEQFSLPRLARWYEDLYRSALAGRRS
jgi:phosphatidylinositol alpha-mannosyltransferase